MKFTDDSAKRFNEAIRSYFDQTYDIQIHRQYELAWARNRLVIYIARYRDDLANPLRCAATLHLTDDGALRLFTEEEIIKASIRELKRLLRG